MSDASPPTALRRLSVRVPSDRAEEARAVFAGLFPDGWEEHERRGELELAVYAGSDAEEPLRGALGKVAVAPLSADWNARWRSFHRPVRIGQLWVGPPWERAPTDACAVVVDPGQAFGTGAHATTRLCLELLLEQPRGSVVDLGCGSGVLAIAAAKLGFSRVVALDRDVAAVEATRANAIANGVQLEVRQTDVCLDELPEADLGLANLELRSIPVVAARFRGRRLIASGYLAGEQATAARWTRVLTRERDGWTAELFERR